MKKIKIRDKFIGEQEPVFIIAEVGVNHILEADDMNKIGAKSSLEVAFKMVDAAKESGVDAIKFQSFTAENLQYKGIKKPHYQLNTTESDEEISYYDLIKKLETSKEDQIKIAEYCKKKDIIFLSTPYDNESADFLDEIINVPAFKISSIDLNNHLFIRYVAKKGKPIIISSGLSTMDDVRCVIKIARKDGFLDRLILMQCTSDYPTRPEDVNLNVIKTYIKEFPEIIVGLSDHTTTYTASIGAVAIGAKVLEKHFTLDKTFRGPDHLASLDVTELKEWVVKVREIETLMGPYEKKVTEAEKRNLSMRKYLVITPQKAGTIITEDVLRTMRTGKGILPVDKNLKKIIGKKLKKDIKTLTPLSWDMIE